MSDEHTAAPEKPKSPLAMFFRPIVLIPLTILAMVAAVPVIYRSTRFSGIAPIEEIVDGKAELRVFVEPEDNAFTYYKSAVSMLPPIPPELDISLGMEAIRNDQGWETVSPEVRTYLKQCEPALAEWRLGTRLDEAVYIDVVTADFCVLIPVTAELRQFARLSVLQTLRCLDEGKTEEAWQWQKAVLRCSRHSGRHGFLIERLVGVAMHRMAAETLVVWATHEKVSTEDLERALTQVREIYKLTAPNSTSLKVEYVALTNTISSAAAREEFANYSGKIPNELVSGYLFVNGEPQLSRVLMRHVFANYLSQCDLPPWERVEAGTFLALYRPTGKESPPLMDPSELNSAVRRSVLAWEMIPAVSQAVVACDMEHARQSALELCLQMERHRRKHGKYPATLEALVPEFLREVPRDWMGQVPADRMLLIRRSFEPPPDVDVERLPDEVPPAADLIIYSRGRNPGDDAGMIEENEDVGLRIPLPRTKASPE